MEPRQIIIAILAVLLILIVAYSSGLFGGASAAPVSTPSSNDSKPVPGPDPVPVGPTPGPPTDSGSGGGGITPVPTSVDIPIPTADVPVDPRPTQPTAPTKPTTTPTPVSQPSILTDCAKYGQSTRPTCATGKGNLVAGLCQVGCPTGYTLRAGLCYRGTLTTDAAKYGDPKAIGAADGPQCAGGNQLYGGVCYKPCPTGYRRTAANTCQKGEILTDASKYGDPKAIGAADGPKCPTSSDLYGGLCYKPCPTGYRRTAANTCQKGEVLTDAAKYGDPKAIGAADGPKCAGTAQLYAGICYKPCPTGYRRTAANTCQKGEVLTDAAKYGDPKAIGTADGPKCAGTAQLYGGLCYKPCPTGYRRTAANTCQRGTLTTDPSKYGTTGKIPQAQCPSGKTLYQGLCYSVPSGMVITSPGFYGPSGSNTYTKGCTTVFKKHACRAGYTDMGCHCQKNIKPITGTVPNPNDAVCPDGAQKYAGGCYKPCPAGTTRTAVNTCKSNDYDLKTSVTTYGLASPSTPNVCPTGRQMYGSTCVKACPTGYNRTAAASCSNLDIKTDPKAYGVASPGTPTICPTGRQMYGSTCVKACPTGYNRTAAASCSNLDIKTDTKAYGLASPSTPNVCPTGRQLYGSTCVKACPTGYNRTAAASCSNLDIKTDPKAYGIASPGTPDVCPTGRQLYASTCVKACPTGTKRTAAATCQSDDYDTKTPPVGTVPDSCPSGQTKIAGLCYQNNCPAGYDRTAACTCAKKSEHLSINRPSFAREAKWWLESMGGGRDAITDEYLISRST